MLEPKKLSSEECIGVTGAVWLCGVICNFGSYGLKAS